MTEGNFVDYVKMFACSGKRRKGIGTPSPREIYHQRRPRWWGWWSRGSRDRPR